MFGRKLTAIEISAAAYDEIVLAVVNSGAPVELVEGGLHLKDFRMLRGPEPEVIAPKHRPISGVPQMKKNSAPGAIS